MENVSNIHPLVNATDVTGVTDVTPTYYGHAVADKSEQLDGDVNANFSVLSNESYHNYDDQYPNEGFYDGGVNANSTTLNNASYNYNYYMYDLHDLYYDEEDPYLLKVYEFELPTLGTVRPILIILTALTNVFVVAYFFNNKRKRENAANLLFISIAFSDTLTGLLLLPNSFRVYMARDGQLSRDWCDTYMILRLYFSRVFHTASVWQTLFLGIQRYICVCRPFISSRICTVKKTLIAITALYVLAFVLHVYHLQEKKSIEDGRHCTWLDERPCEGMCVYLWACVLLQHLLPSLVLVVLTARTLRGIRGATRRLSNISKSSTSRRMSRDRTITITSSIVVVVFLIPELPHGVYKLVIAISAHGGHEAGIQRNTRTNHVIICIYELVLLASFHANFWIYCSMMHEFRQAVIRLVTCSCRPETQRRHPRWRKGSTSSRKNSASSLSHSRTGSVLKRLRVLSQTSTLSNASETAHAGKSGKVDEHQGPNDFKLGSIDTPIETTGEDSSMVTAPEKEDFTLSNDKLQDVAFDEPKAGQGNSNASSDITNDVRSEPNESGETNAQIERLMTILDTSNCESNTPTDSPMQIQMLATPAEVSCTTITTLGTIKNRSSAPIEVQAETLKANNDDSNSQVGKPVPTRDNMATREHLATLDNIITCDNVAARDNMATRDNIETDNVVPDTARESCSMSMSRKNKEHGDISTTHFFDGGRDDTIEDDVFI